MLTTKRASSPRVPPALGRLQMRRPRRRFHQARRAPRRSLHDSVEHTVVLTSAQRSKRWKTSPRGWNLCHARGQCEQSQLLSSHCAKNWIRTTGAQCQQLPFAVSCDAFSEEPILLTECVLWNRRGEGKCCHSLTLSLLLLGVGPFPTSLLSPFGWCLIWRCAVFLPPALGGASSLWAKVLHSFLPLVGGSLLVLSGDAAFLFLLWICCRSRLLLEWCCRAPALVGSGAPPPSGKCCYLLSSLGW